MPGEPRVSPPQASVTGGSWQLSLLLLQAEFEDQDLAQPPTRPRPEGKLQDSLQLD